MKILPKAISGILITGLLSTAIIASPTFAHDDERGKKRGPNIERLAERLELSEAQKVSFIEIMTVQLEKRQALQEEVKAERAALKTETLESLQTILDEEQLGKMEKMMERRKKHKRS